MLELNLGMGVFRFTANKHFPGVAVSPTMTIQIPGCKPRLARPIIRSCCSPRDCPHPSVRPTMNIRLQNRNERVLVMVKQSESHLL
ncbi:hypothetical protein KC19_VG313000 [Ceratodon purpureus]|uniref:Uncharacterized protein n=1 Tax=Ceratodon purpureus TaxID=3225 RepID=A0A8T0HX58_CERPU|nr:hypothetical protein KC19_VG313000 [Ceratodon purpureus]